MFILDPSPEPKSDHHVWNIPSIHNPTQPRLTRAANPGLLGKFGGGWGADRAGMWTVGAGREKGGETVPLEEASWPAPFSCFSQSMSTENWRELVKVQQSRQAGQ